MRADADAAPVAAASRELIVAFDGFASHAALSRRVADALRDVTTTYRVAPRPRHVRGTPTDFVSLLVPPLHAERASASLRRQSRVRSVTPSRRYAREIPEPSSSQQTPALPRRHLLQDTHKRGAGQPKDFITRALGAAAYWKRGATGRGVRVAIFDTGLPPTHDVANVEEVVNFTGEDSTEDKVGHSSFMAGVIAGRGECGGFAPDATVLFARVFDSQQQSTTKWFLEAFNYALRKKVDLINLSVGGPDFRDAPFLAKVRALAASGVLIASGSGNSGPAWGSLLNPADDALTVGVAGTDISGGLAAWSSRGETLWENPHGAGRVGVDVITHGEFWGAAPGGGCQHQWGTSVSCPVVVGVLAMLLSSVAPGPRRDALRSPAALKQVLARGSARMGGNASHLEQGVGQLDVGATARAFSTFAPHLSAQPASLDLTDCPYLWPYCDQPLYATAQPLLLNVTLLNSAARRSRLAAPPRWIADANGDALTVAFASAGDLDAWVGFLGVRLSVPAAAARWSGDVAGRIEIDVEPLHPNGSALEPAAAAAATLRVTVPLRVRVVPTPPRASRLLFDIFHSSQYPTGFFPNDDISQHNVELMDWNGDSPFTSFRSLYTELRAAGYYVEVLRSDFSTFDAASYGALLLLDSEERFLPAELTKLADDVRRRGLGLVVAADWWDATVMRGLYYKDQHTGVANHCGMGGANVPALNRLLRPFGIGFQSRIFEGSYSLGGRRVDHLSGTALASFPSGGLLHHAFLKRYTGQRKAKDAPTEAPERVPVLGLHALPDPPPSGGGGGGGWVLAMGDSSCLDDSVPHAIWQERRPCRFVVTELIGYMLRRRRGGGPLRPALLAQSQPLRAPFADAAPYDDKLSANQLAAFRKQSRVWAIVQGCREDGPNCTMPIVPPPRWVEALPSPPPPSAAAATGGRARAFSRAQWGAAHSLEAIEGEAQQVLRHHLALACAAAALLALGLLALFLRPARRRPRRAVAVYPGSTLKV